MERRRVLRNRTVKVDEDFEPVPDSPMSDAYEEFEAGGDSPYAPESDEAEEPEAGAPVLHEEDEDDEDHLVTSSKASVAKRRKERIQTSCTLEDCCLCKKGGFPISLRQLPKPYPTWSNICIVALYCLAGSNNGTVVKEKFLKLKENIYPFVRAHWKALYMDKRVRKGEDWRKRLQDTLSHHKWFVKGGHSGQWALRAPFTSPWAEEEKMRNDQEIQTEGMEAEKARQLAVQQKEIAGLEQQVHQLKDLCNKLAPLKGTMESMSDHLSQEITNKQHHANSIQQILAGIHNKLRKQEAQQHNLNVILDQLMQFENKLSGFVVASAVKPCGSFPQCGPACPNSFCQLFYASAK